MTSSKIRLLSVMAMLIITLIGVWVSTQWVAKLLSYQKALGSEWFILHEKPIYPPKFLYWWIKYGTYAPKQFDLAATALFLAVVCNVGVMIIAEVLAAKDKKEPTTFGSAHWANEKDVKKIGLLNNNGVVLGLNKKDGRYLRHDGPEHIMVMAPTRSGKGVGLIIPTLLTWPHSVLVTDIKGENFGITSGFRQRYMKNKVLKFDPTCTDGSSVRYNPLSEIRIRTMNEVRDAQNLADMIVDPQGTGQLDHWDKTGYDLIVGVVLHLKYTLANARLKDIASFLSNPEKTFDESLVEMMSTIHDTTGLFREIYKVDSEIHPIVAEAARAVMNKSANERSGVLSTATAIMGLYRDPIVALNTEISEFSISDLMNYEDPISLYLVVPPSDINRTRPLIRMILNQVSRRLTETMKFKHGKPIVNYKHRLLLLLDEFPALGRLDAFEAALAYIASYGLRAFLIIQSLNQLYKTYTQNNSIVDNCHIRIAYTPNDEKTPEFISKLLGTKTETYTTQTYHGSRFYAWLHGNTKISTTAHQVARQLLTPGEISQLPADEEIVFVGGNAPVLARKLAYYKDKNFVQRLMDSPVKSDVITKTTMDSINRYETISRFKTNSLFTIEENPNEPVVSDSYHDDLIPSYDLDEIKFAEAELDFI